MDQKNTFCKDVARTITRMIEQKYQALSHVNALSSRLDHTHFHEDMEMAKMDLEILLVQHRDYFETLKIVCAMIHN